jgi:RNA polymerase sigma-70 factor, ECF subfamily
MTTHAADLAQLWKAHSPRLLAALTQRLRHLQSAEDALAHAFERALAWREWPEDPPAWLYRCALNAAIDQMRRGELLVSDEAATAGAIDDAEAPSDQRLAMLFLCAHPSLSQDAQIAMILRFGLGLQVGDIARWCYENVDTVQRRLHRAKSKLQLAKARFDLPAVSLWSERLPPVLSALEIIYDQSYTNVGGGFEMDGFAREAEQLVLHLSAQLPNAEVLGLAALIVLAESRRGARLDADGVMIPLDQQDPKRWDSVRIAVAAKLLRRAGAIRTVGPYQIRAMISAQHARRMVLGNTPWPEIAELYRALQQFDDSPQAKINHVLALAGQHGPAVGGQHLRALRVESPSLAKQLPFLLAEFALARANQEFELAHEALAQALQDPSLGKAERAYLQQQCANVPQSLPTCMPSNQCKLSRRATGDERSNGSDQDQASVDNPSC